MKRATKKKVKKPKYNGPKTPQKTPNNPLGWKRTNWPSPNDTHYLSGCSGYIEGYTMFTGSSSIRASG